MCSVFFSLAQIKEHSQCPINTRSIWKPNNAITVFEDDFNRKNKIEEINSNKVESQSNIFKKYILKNANVAFSNDVIETTPNNYVIIGQTYDTIGTQLHWRLTLTGIDQNYTQVWKKSYGSNSFNYTHNLFAPMHLVKKNNFLYCALIVEDSNYKQPGVFIKFNFNGDTIWQKKFYVNNDLFTFTSVCPSVDNGFLITGAVQTNTPGFNNHPVVATYLLKTDANGNKLWDKRFYKTNLDYTQAGYRIIQDSITKKILIAGVQSNGTGQLSNLQILDSLGNYINQLGSNGNMGNGLFDLIKLRDGNFLSSGGVIHPEKLIVGIPTSASLLVKFNPTGNIIFTKEYDTLVTNNIIFSLLEDANGNFITGGHFTTLQQYNMGINDISRVAKVDKNGNLLWKKYFDNYTNNMNQDGLSGMILTSDGNIAFTNYLNGGNVPRPLNYSFYKTDTTYCDVNSIGCYTYVGLKENELKKNLVKIYPNPASNYCTFNFNELSNIRAVSIEVKNALGQNVYKAVADTYPIYILNTSSYNCGLYFITVSVNNQLVAQEKLIIIK